MEALKGVTTAESSTPQTDEKYKVVAPETMQETFMSDSEDENGEYRSNCQHHIRKNFTFCFHFRSLTHSFFFFASLYIAYVFSNNFYFIFGHL